MNLALQSMNVCCISSRDVITSSQYNQCFTSRKSQDMVGGEGAYQMDRTEQLADRAVRQQSTVVTMTSKCVSEVL